MLQKPRPGEYVVDIPGAGTLLSRHSYLNRLFGGMLASGSEQLQDGMRCVSWRVEGLDPLPAADPRHGMAVARLRSFADQSRAVAVAMRAALDASPEGRLSLGGAVAALLGRPEAAATVLSRVELKQLAEVHDLAARAVEHGLERGHLFIGPTGATLANWAYLPSGTAISESPRPPVVTLTEPRAGTGGDRLLEWSVSGSADRVELRFLTASGSATVLESGAIDEDRASGAWTVPVERLAVDGVLRAIASGAGGTSASADIPVRALVPPTASSSVAAPEPAPPPPVPEALTRPPVARRRRSIPAWARWLLLGLLLLLLLGLVAWFAWRRFPPAATVVRGDWLLIAPRLPADPPADPRVAPAPMQSPRGIREIRSSAPTTKPRQPEAAKPPLPVGPPAREQPRPEPATRDRQMEVFRVGVPAGSPKP